MFKQSISLKTNLNLNKPNTENPKKSTTSEIVLNEKTTQDEVNYIKTAYYTSFVHDELCSR